MFKHRIEAAEKVKILEFLKSLSVELKTSIDISKSANGLSEKVLSRSGNLKIEDFKKQWLDLMDLLENMFNCTGDTETYLPAVNDKKGSDLLLGLQAKASEYYACQLGNLRMHLNGVEAKLGGDPNPLETKVIKRSNTAVIRAFNDLMDSAVRLANYYQISRNEWQP